MDGPPASRWRLSSASTAPPGPACRSSWVREGRADGLAKGERDWTQLDAFEAEYRERLAVEKKRRDSQFLAVLADVAKGRKDFYSDELKARDEETRRLFTLRGKILSLREKLGLPEEMPLDVERPFVAGNATAATGAVKKSRRIRFL